MKTSFNSLRISSIILVLLCIGIPARAHETITSLSEMSKEETILAYLAFGFQHILPKGLDHILFIVSLFLVSPNLKTLLAQVSAFTVAHSITLALTLYDIVSPPAYIVEPLIALTIVYVALENIFGRNAPTSRLILVFIFGLIHGLGFAGALSTLGLPEQSYLLCLVMFNVGVELGQLTILLGLYFTLGRYLSQKSWYQQRAVRPLSAIILCMACYWTIERLFL